MANVRVVRGDTLSFTVTITEEQGGAFDLTAASVFCFIKASSFDDDNEAELTLFWHHGGSSDGITVTQPTSGVATITLTPAQTAALTIGVHVYVVRVVKSGHTWTVASGKLHVVVAPSPVRGMSRRELRRAILRELGDLVVLRATATGSTVTLIDEVRLTGESGAYRGREVLFTDGTAANIGQVRYVAGSSQSARAITFADALPAVTVEGDEAEMVNTRGIGFRFNDVHEAINQAIAEIAHQAATVAASEVTSFAYGDGVAIPSSFFALEGVQWQDEQQRWHAIPRATAPSKHGWWFDPSSFTVHIDGIHGRRANGRPIRLWGAIEPAPLMSDDDESPIAPAWLKAKAIANLLYARFLRHPQPEYERMMAWSLQQAERLRARALRRRSPLSVRVR